MTALLLFLAFLQPPPPPPFAALWDRPGVARLSWSQPSGVALTCLIRNSTLIRCWQSLPAGLTVFNLGGAGPLDGAHRAHAGDTFTLSQDGTQTRARLIGRVLLAVLRG